MAAAARGGVAATRPVQSVAQVTTGELPRGSESKRDRCQNGNRERERKDHRIDSHFVNARKISRRQELKRIRSPISQREAQRTASQRQQQAFTEKLFNQAGTSGS